MKVDFGHMNHDNHVAIDVVLPQPCFCISTANRRTCSQVLLLITRCCHEIYISANVEKSPVFQYEHRLDIIVMPHCVELAIGVPRCSTHATLSIRCVLGAEAHHLTTKPRSQKWHETASDRILRVFRLDSAPGPSTPLPDPFEIDIDDNCAEFGLFDPREGNANDWL